MKDEFDAVLAALGLKLVNAVVAAFASFISLRFWDGLDSRERWTTFFGGWGIAAWGAAPFAAWIEKKEVEILIVIAFGIFGMAACSEIWKVLRDTDWKGLFQSVVGRRQGGDPK